MMKRKTANLKKPATKKAAPKKAAPKTRKPSTADLQRKQIEETGRKVQNRCRAVLAALGINLGPNAPGIAVMDYSRGFGLGRLTIALDFGLEAEARIMAAARQSDAQEVPPPDPPKSWLEIKAEAAAAEEAQRKARQVATYVQKLYKDGK